MKNAPSLDTPLWALFVQTETKYLGNRNALKATKHL